MKQTITSLLKEFVKIAVISLVLIVPVFAVWQEPTDIPSGGNAPAPINVSSDTQTFTDSKELKMRTDGLGVLDITGGLGVSGVLQSFSDSYFDGRVGIGNITPQAKLDVKGVGNEKTTFGLGVRNSDDNYSLVVTDEGKVGIGTADPAEELGVNGDIRASGTIGGIGTMVNCTKISMGRADHLAPSTPCAEMMGTPGTPTYCIVKCSPGWSRESCGVEIFGKNYTDCCVKYDDGLSPPPPPPLPEWIGCEKWYP